MKSKIRKIGSWQEWKSICKKHDFEMITINVAVVLGVFVAAAIIQFN